MLTAIVLTESFGCAARKQLRLSPVYVQTNDGNGNVIATIPIGGSLLKTLDELGCGVMHLCRVFDYGRVFHVQINEKHAIIQDLLPERSDLDKLIGCGVQYICLLDQKAIITVKKKQTTVTEKN